MKRLEVRCCCQPQKLLGTLPVTDNHGASFQFTVMKPRTYDFDFSRLPITTPVNRQFVTMPIESFVDMSGPHPKYGLAVKAEGVPIETLRLIPGFIEHKGATT